MFVYTLFSFLPFMVALFWTVMIVLDNIHGWKKSFMPKLLALALVCTLFFFAQAFHYLVPDQDTAIPEIILYVCGLAIYPVLFIFIKKITTSKDMDFYDYLLFLPSVVLIVCSVVFKMTGSVNTGLFGWVIPIYYFVMIYLSIKSSICIIRYDRQIQNFYSNTTSKTFAIILWIMYLMLFSSVLSILKSIIGRDYFSGSMLIAIPSLLVSVILFIFFYKGIKIDFTAEDASADQLDVNQILQYWKKFSFIQNVKKAGESVSPTVYEDLIKELDNAIRVNKMYRNSELKITDVADAVASNRTYVSNAINQGLNMSFSDYINKLRVEEVMDKLVTMENGKTVKQVSEEVGFNNDATFYRHFRKVTGMTPVEWINKNRLNR
ncbi:MAG: AraC family transcriptional regulator [Bacteroidaceae bacterium]|nr:AraC family transcriptional regulator [Bacteroidaceae bacterium]